MKVFRLARFFGLLFAASLLTACGTAKLVTAVETSEQPQLQTLEVDVVDIQLNNVFTDANGLFTYTIESNSNSSVVSPSISGNNLKFVFHNLGTSVITFKETDAQSSRLASLTVEITEGAAFQPADVQFTVGSNFLADTTAGFSYNNLQNSNPSVVAANISGVSMTLDFLRAGTSTISFDEVAPDDAVRPASFTITGRSCDTIIAVSKSLDTSATEADGLASVCSPPISDD